MNVAQLYIASVNLPMGQHVHTWYTCTYIQLQTALLCLKALWKSGKGDTGYWCFMAGMLIAPVCRLEFPLESTVEEWEKGYRILVFHCWHVDSSSV